MNSSDVIEITPVVVDKTSQKDKSQRIYPGAFNEQLNHYKSKQTKQYLKHKNKDSHRVSKLVNAVKFMDDSKSSLNKQINSYRTKQHKNSELGNKNISAHVRNTAYFPDVKTLNFWKERKETYGRHRYRSQEWLNYLCYVKQMTTKC